MPAQPQCPKMLVGSGRDPKRNMWMFLGGILWMWNCVVIDYWKSYICNGYGHKWIRISIRHYSEQYFVVSLLLSQSLAELLHKNVGGGRRRRRSYVEKQQKRIMNSMVLTYRTWVRPKHTSWLSNPKTLVPAPCVYEYYAVLEFSQVIIKVTIKSINLCWWSKGEQFHLLFLLLAGFLVIFWWYDENNT